MAAAGRKPVDGPKRNRSKAVHDWTLVADVPFDGERPDLPKTTLVSGRSAALVAQTKLWWDVVSTMPHCVLWERSDWMFALSTVYVAEAVFRGDMVRAAELRHREAKMGVLAEDRRDLRIRYVDPAELEDGDGQEDKPASKKGKGGSNVTSMDARRRRLTADAS